MNSSFELDTKAFEGAIQRLLGRSPQMAINAMKEAAEEVKASSLRVVPRATDTLANSFFADVEVTTEEVVVNLGYGKGNPMNPKSGVRVSEYMVAVHENVGAKHPKGGSAKFLETPVREYRERFAGKLAVHIRSEIERSGL